MKKPSYNDLLFENELLIAKARKLLNKNIKLKKRIQFIDEIIETINAMTYINDSIKEVLIWANKKYESISGYTLEERRSMSYEKHRSTYHPDDFYLLQSTKAQVQTNDNTEPAFYRYKHKSGKWIWLFGFGCVIKRLPNGEPWLVFNIGLDFTPRVEFQFPDFDKLSKAHFSKINKDLIKLLTNKEKEIILHLSKGLTTKEVAALLFKSYHTINTHKRNAMSKLNFNKITDLVNFAVKTGLGD